MNRTLLAILAFAVALAALGVRQYETQKILHVTPPLAQPPLVHVNGFDAHYDDHDHVGEVILFAHSLFFTGEMWDEQVRYFNELGYRCVTYDQRGQGRSETPTDGAPITFDQLSDDVIALIEELDLAPVHYVGVSMGAMNGLHVALKRPELLRSMTLMAVSAQEEDTSNSATNTILAWIVKWFGVQSFVVDQVVHHMFGETFLGADTYQRAVILKQWRAHFMSLHPLGIIEALAGVWQRPNILRRLGSIAGIPTLIMQGAEDRSVPMAHARSVFGALPNRTTQLKVLPKTGHLMSLERPHEVNAMMKEFLEEVSVDRVG